MVSIVALTPFFSRKAPYPQTMYNIAAFKLLCFTETVDNFNLYGISIKTYIKTIIITD